MERVLTCLMTLLWTHGMLPVGNPFRCLRPDAPIRIGTFGTILVVLFLLMNICHVGGSIVTTSWYHDFIQSPAFKIAYYVSEGGQTASSALIQWCMLKHWKGILSISKFLATQVKARCTMGDKRLRPSRTTTKAFALLFAYQLCLFIYDGQYFVKEIYRRAWVGVGGTRSFIGSKYLAYIVYIQSYCFNYWKTRGASCALMILGLLLLESYQALLWQFFDVAEVRGHNQDIKSRLFRICQLQRFEAVSRKLGQLKPQTVNSRQFHDQLALWKTHWDEYQLFFGTCTLVLLLRAATAIVGAVMGHVFINHTSNGNNDTTFQDVNVVVNLVLLVGIAALGSHLDGQLNEVQEALADAEALIVTDEKREVQLLLQWVRGWKWKLRASDLFDVGNGVVLSIAGVVMSFFIFVFQVRSAERHPILAYQSTSASSLAEDLEN